MRVSRLLSGNSSTPSALANFDSTTAFVRATARYLRGEGFPRQGIISRPVAAVLPLLNHLPHPIQQQLYRISGASEAVSPEKLGDVAIENFRRWVTDQYPERGYPAVVVGSTNGAAVHLAALLGIPWLPQTFLIPVRRSISAGAGTADLEWGRDPGQRLLAANPDVQLHQMHDPNQDRLMVSEIAYFRLKLRQLGTAYKQFLAKTLAPDGTIVVINCGNHWPTTRVSDRHVFQFGGLGGLRPEEYLEGSDRVDAFLAEQGGPQPIWNPPDPDGHSPEAEWGFEPALGDDVQDFAGDQGYDVHQLTISDPRDLSDFVAGLYRHQYAERGLDTDRLFVQNFTLVDPWWTLRTGSVPFWLPFNASPAADSLESYLKTGSEPFDEIYMTLFSNAIHAAGQTPIDRWQELLAVARTRGAFVGVDPEAYPTDASTYVRYHSALPETIPRRQPLLPPISLDELASFVEAHPREYPVEWKDALVVGK